METAKDRPNGANTDLTTARCPGQVLKSRIKYIKALVDQVNMFVLKLGKFQIEAFHLIKLTFQEARCRFNFMGFDLVELPDSLTRFRQRVRRQNIFLLLPLICK